MCIYVSFILHSVKCLFSGFYLQCSLLGKFFFFINVFISYSVTDDCVANRAESTSEGLESSTDDGLTTTIDPLDEEQALKDMDQMDKELTELVQISVEYDWEYYTHVSQETASDSVGINVNMLVIGVGLKNVIFSVSDLKLRPVTYCIFIFFSLSAFVL